MTGLQVLSTLAVKGLMGELAAHLPGAAPEIVYAPTALLTERIRGGARGDVAILTAAGIAALAAEGVLDGTSRRDVAVSAVGVAVRAGAPHPDLSTPEAVRRLLREVPSLCYSRAGASGLHFARVIARLGIAEEVNAKATIVPSGFTAEAVADGRCAIAIQQVSELLVVPGIEVAGPLPDAIQETLTFSAAVFADTREAPAARDLIEQITRAELAAAYARHGLRLASP
ncbi:MAG: substrate-binding domain-containing protein [Hyphomicrobiaceae bacterium]|nr:substrate-binding domain-containing protein [Hyphomicrobiaceae bacterium]